MRGNQKFIILALGGSVIVPEKIQRDFLKKFRKFILKFLKKGRKFVIVTGGGATARNYIQAVSKIAKASDADKDWLGISATKINAQLLQTFFKKEAYPIILDSPFKKIKKESYRLFVASGWRPGWSTDYVAILLAKRFKTKNVIFATNIDYLYDKDPNLYKNARPIEEINWKNYQKLISPKWKPGMKVPIDPKAVRLASELKMTAIIALGTNLKNLENIIKGQKFKGTVIKP